MTPGSMFLYIQNEYPVLSQTFVSAEVEELARRGHTVLVVSLSESGFALDRGAVDVVSLRQIRLLTIISSWLKMVLTHPVISVRIFSIAVGYGTKYLSVVPYVPSLAKRIHASAGVCRLHTHFATRAAVLAHLVQIASAGQPRRSLTVHAADIYLGGGRRLVSRLSKGATVLTISRFNQDLLESWGVASKLAYCGIDPATVSPDVADVKGAPHLVREVLAVGRLVTKKGFENLVEALGMLSSNYSDLRCSIVGTGPLHNDLAQAIQRLGLESTVRLEGARGHQDVLEMMTSSRMLVVPSVVAENGDMDGIPVVILEALSRRLPVVATAVSGIPEVIDETTGILVPPGDSSALATAIGSVLNDESRSKSRSTAGFKRVMSFHTIASQADSVEGV